MKKLANKKHDVWKISVYFKNVEIKVKLFG